MNRKTVLIRSATGMLSIVMLATSGGLALAAAGDYTTREQVPAGVTVSGIDIGGLTPAQVREVVENAVVEPLLQPLSAHSGDSSFEIDPAGLVFVDVEDAVDEAYEPSRTSTLATRAVRLAAGRRVVHEVEPRIDVDTEALSLMVARFAEEIDRDPIDARISIEDGVAVVRPAADGVRVDVDAAVESLTEALLSGAEAADLPTQPVSPAVSDADLGKTIVVRLASRTLELYEGTGIDRTYRIAVGKPGHSTPRGSWEITAKRYMPTWGNPGSAWAADMPATIPPGPGNPLGTRAMNLNVSGIRIHGTSATRSIGTAASHGCMRMVRRDVEELYNLVDVGTPVLIVAR